MRAATHTTQGTRPGQTPKPQAAKVLLFMMLIGAIVVFAIIAGH